MDYVIGQSYPIPKSKPSQSLRDIIPNGTDFRSRNFQALKESRKSYRTRFSVDFWDEKAKTFSCPYCGVAAGEPCISMGKTTLGIILKHTHWPRRVKASKIIHKKRNLSGHQNQSGQV